MAVTCESETQRPAETTTEQVVMSLRDYFAGQALIGILTHDMQQPRDVAAEAYHYADAMLRAREGR